MTKDDASLRFEEAIHDPRIVIIAQLLMRICVHLANDADNDCSTNTGNSKACDHNTKDFKSSESGRNRTRARVRRSLRTRTGMGMRTRARARMRLRARTGARMRLRARTGARWPM